MKTPLRSILLAAATGLGLAASPPVGPALMAQSAAPDTGIAGRWQGTLNTGGGGLRLVLEVTKASDGLLSGILRSLDQGGTPIPVQKVSVAGDSVHVEIPVIGGRYDAVMSADRARLTGTFSQGQPIPLVLTRMASAAAVGPATTIAPASPLGLMIDVSAPTRPMLFPGKGKRHLIYELHLVNVAGGDMLLTRLEALGNDGRTLATYEGSALGGILSQARPNVSDARAIPPGVRAIAFIEITLDSGVTAPTSIHHRITTSVQSVETAAIPVATSRPIVIGAPFVGENWVAVNGPGNTSGHRRAFIPVSGHGTISQRFAIDWLQVSESGSTHPQGNAADNRSYLAYGKEVLAVADGIVTSTKDSIPENVPGGRAVPITLETIAGNHVILDLGGGLYAMYAHLQPGSLRVRAGQRVRRGDVIALLGNSGNSTEPHLHFQVMDGPSPLGAEGLPYAIDSWEGRTEDDKWVKHTNELPMQNAVVRILPSRGRGRP